MLKIVDLLTAPQQVQRDEFNDFVAKFLRKEEIEDFSVNYRARCVAECAECVDTVDHNGRSLLHWAVIDGDFEAVRFFVSEGADVNLKCSLGNTPLHWVTCLWFDKENIFAKYLVSKGGRVNTKNKNGMTSLHYAVFYGRLNSAKFLIGAGAKLNARTKFGDTALHLAVRHADVTQFLILAGADINAKNTRGNTPLHEAVWLGTLEAVKILVAAGADIEAEDAFDATPLDLAESNGQTEIAEYLLELS